MPPMRESGQSLRSIEREVLMAANRRSGGGRAMIALMIGSAGFIAEVYAQQSLEQILKNGVVVPSTGQRQAAAPAAQAPVQPTSAGLAAAAAAPQGGAGFKMDLPPGW